MMTHADRLRSLAQSCGNEYFSQTAAAIKAGAEALDELARLKRKAPLCEKHLEGSGTRSGCPYCTVTDLHAALSKIDHAFDPNELEASAYDFDLDAERVVKRVLDALDKKACERWLNAPLQPLNLTHIEIFVKENNAHIPFYKGWAVWLPNCKRWMQHNEGSDHSGIQVTSYEPYVSLGETVEVVIIPVSEYETLTTKVEES